MGFTNGCRSKGVWHAEQIGITPLGGRRTIEGPQQHVGQRKRGMMLALNSHNLASQLEVSDSMFE